MRAVNRQPRWPREGLVETDLTTQCAPMLGNWIVCKMLSFALCNHAAQSPLTRNTAILNANIDHLRYAMQARHCSFSASMFARKSKHHKKLADTMQILKQIQIDSAWFIQNRKRTHNCRLCASCAKHWFISKQLYFALQFSVHVCCFRVLVSEWSLNAYFSDKIK